MRIYFYNTGYRWNSFSIVRSTFEILSKFSDCISVNTIPKEIKNCYLFIFDSKTSLNDEQYQNFKKSNVKVIKFGISDPTGFEENIRLKNNDLYCTSNLNIYNKYKSNYNIYHYKVSCDVRYHKSYDVNKEYFNTFIGSCNHPMVSFRKKYIEEIRNNNINIDVFGEGWEEHSHNHKFLGGDALIKTFNKTELSVDITNKDAPIGRRIYESSACSTPVITYRKDDILLEFEEDKEILCYSTLEELISKLKYYSKHKHLLKYIGDNASQRCREEHDIIYRVKDLLKEIKKID